MVRGGHGEKAKPEYPLTGAPVTEQGNVGSLQSGCTPKRYGKQGGTTDNLSALARKDFFCARAVLFLHTTDWGSEDHDFAEGTMATLFRISIESPASRHGLPHC